MKFLLSKHSRSIFIFALLSLFLCMAAGKASAKERNPVVKIDNTSYTSSGTEVTLRLWMFNWKYAVPNTKKYNARFTGDVSLYIDDKEVGKLNSMWGLISGSSYTFFKDEPGIVGKSSDINLDGTNVGTAQFQDLKSVQTCPYNNNTTENSWYTVDLKLSFNKSFSYYGHKITVKGKWQDQGSGSVVEKNVTLDNTINGFVRPVNLSAQPSGGNMVFSWEQEGYNPSASTDGKWIVYKREGDNNVKVGEAAANEHSLSIEKKQNSCSNVYIMTFLPKACEVEETICGLTTTFTATEHQINVDDICQICGHSFFRYQTTDGNKVDISNKNFGATVVAHEVVDGKCVIEFDAPITKIPTRAFYNCKNLTGNLVLPNSVTTIGEQAFSGCSGFTGDLTIPNSVKTIGESAFSGCSGFTGDLIIPNSVTTIRKRAFYGCSGFTGSLTLPNSVTTIESSAFYNCKGFTGDLSLPKSLEVVGTGFLEKCNNIQTITFLSLPIGISGYLGDLTKTVSLSDDSYISSNKEDGTIDAISYTRTMTSNWGTLVLPYSLTLTGNEPYRLYAISAVSENELVLKQLDGEVAAGTPCVVKRNGSESELTFGANDAELNMTIDGKTVGNMTFNGTYWTKDVTNGYIIAKDCFWSVAELNKSDLVKGVKVKPFRAWLDGTSPNGASQLSICVSDTATGIGAAGTIDVLNDTATEYYDLSGKRLDEPQKGVNIVRMKSGKTKKIIIK
jgi:hypothetical protein